MSRVGRHTRVLPTGLSSGEVEESCVNQQKKFLKVAYSSPRANLVSGSWHLLLVQIRLQTGDVQAIAE